MKVLPQRLLSHGKRGRRMVRSAFKNNEEAVGEGEDSVKEQALSCHPLT